MVVAVHCDDVQRSAFLKSALKKADFGQHEVDKWLTAPLNHLEKEMSEVRDQSQSSREWYEKRLARYIQNLTIPAEHLRVMVQSFVHELWVGLEHHKASPTSFVPSACSFKMLDACVKNLPTGSETGIYYALDFGGTNFRAVRVHLKGNGKLTVRQKRASLLSAPGILHAAGLMDSKATATEMFDFFANMVHDFMVEEGDIGGGENTERACGFTFSFPCTQRLVDVAHLMTWTKGFATGREGDDPVEGCDVAELMNVALTRNKVPMICNSILNDTVGTLLSCAYEMDRQAHPPCMVGMILGTGMNCAYVDESSKWFGYSGCIINIECGNFNRDLPRTNVDCELDFSAVANRGFQQTEKMCSGAYLGEISRMTFVKVFQYEVPATAWKPGSFGTDKVAAIVVDETEDLSITCELAREAWGVTLGRTHCRALKKICTAVLDRSASIAAVLIASCAQKTGRLQPAFGGLSVAIDGSLYKLNPWYQRQVTHHLAVILGPVLANLIHILCADDGSGKGAGILAATVAKNG